MARPLRLLPALAGLLSAALCLDLSRAAPAPAVILTTRIEKNNPAPCQIEGDAALAQRPANLASTFKVFLAWVALEEGCATPQTLRPVADRHVPGTPREITLQEALFHSSNDYFIGLLPPPVLGKLPDYLARSGLASQPPARWLQGPPREICSGGTLRATPIAAHAFMLRIARGELTSSPTLQNDLETACLWPPRDVPWQIHGKTGTMTGAVWFNGFARESATGTTLVRTVFIPGTLDRRPDAIRLFYQGLGLTWNPEWSSWLNP